MTANVWLRLFSPLLLWLLFAAFGFVSQATFGYDGRSTVAAKTVAPAKRASGSTVLGHYPEYSNLADGLGYRRLDIPKQAWDKMTDAERWAANQKFLDRTIARGDEIILATPLDKVRPGSYFARELEYLSSKGYRPSAYGTRLVPGGN